MGNVAVSPPVGALPAPADGRTNDGGIDENHCSVQRSRFFYEYYQIDRPPAGDDESEPATDGELKNASHSPFGNLFQIASQGVWTWKELIYRIPWSVVLAAINDQPRYGKTDSDDSIKSEEAAKNFFGLK